MDQAANLRNIIKNKNTSPNDFNNQTLSNLPNSDSKRARVITITSGKGGVGKSNTAINLSMALSDLGQRVVVIDADFGLANIEILLGIRPKYNLSDILFNNKTIHEVITYGPKNIGFISGGSGVFELMNLKKDQILKLTKNLYELDKIADIIIIDTGAGINDNVIEFIMSSSDVFIVVTPEPTSITDSYSLLKVLDKNPNFSSYETSIQIIASGVKDEIEGLELYQKIRGVANKFLNLDIHYLGMVPFDKNVRKAVIKQVPYLIEYPNTKASLGIHSIAKKIYSINKDQEEGKKAQGIVGMIYHFFKNKLG